MKPRNFSPLKLDVEAFARDGASLHGEWPAETLERLAGCGAPEVPLSRWPSVRWQLRGERIEPRGAAPETWLHVSAEAIVAQTCQRCLRPVEEHLKVESAFLFVDGEEAAAELDAEHEHDVLAMTRSLDARELVEDELLLALPLVPRHDDCEAPVPPPSDFLPGIDDKPKPFAALAALKKGGKAQ